MMLKIFVHQHPINIQENNAICIDIWFAEKRGSHQLLYGGENLFPSCRFQERFQYTAIKAIEKAGVSSHKHITFQQ